MITALLLAAAVPTAVDAELAFARDARRIGQWTAFRKYADRDAVMFTPQAVWVQTYLKGTPDPAKAINWRPAHSFVSCDGRTAVNTGPRVQPPEEAENSVAATLPLLKRRIEPAVDWTAQSVRASSYTVHAVVLVARWATPLYA